MNKEDIERVIRLKKEKLPAGVSVVGLDSGFSADVQASWLVELLSRVYVEHGITKKIDRLLDDISLGKCRLWFAVRDGRPIASSALIKQADGSVEVGRAVSLENGVGGLLMLMAVASHLNDCDRPVVAEVRMADGFVGVPSGEATQIISFRHLGLMPHALVPAFNHGVPKRQEMFMFSSSDTVVGNEPAFLPDNLEVMKALSQTAMAFVESTFQDGLEVRTCNERQINSGWSVVSESPFCVVVPDVSGVSMELVTKEAEIKSPFTLIPLVLRRENTARVIECFEKGFVPCGFDRSLDNGWPILLFGRLRRDTLLAPIRIVDGLLDDQVVLGANKIDACFRSGLDGNF